MKFFSEISRKTSNDSLNNPQIRNTVIRSRIRNNIITIDRFRFRVFGFRPRIEGQTSFDGQLNIKMRLGLPPLGIIGIPITVSGTHDNPQIKIGRKTEDLEEVEYTDE